MTWNQLAALIPLMTQEQAASDVTVAMDCETYMVDGLITSQDQCRTISSEEAADGLDGTIPEFHPFLTLVGDE